jgi:hypothetical protein
MATEKYVAGTVGLTWTSAGFGTEINSLASGNAVLASTALDNSTNLDIFCDVSVSLGSVTTGAGAPFIGLYLYALIADGTTYGDGRFSSAASGPPPQQYSVGAIACAPSTTGVIAGPIRGIIMPPGKWKFVLYNNAGVALAASGNTVQYRTYNRSVS